MNWGVGGGTTLTASGSRRSSRDRLRRASSSSSSPSLASFLTRRSSIDSTSSPSAATAGAGASSDGASESSASSSTSSSSRLSSMSSMFPLSGRGIVLPENRPATPFRRVNAGDPLLVPTGGKEVTRTKEKERRRRGPKRPLGPRRRGAAFSTQPLGSSPRRRQAPTRPYCRSVGGQVSNVQALTGQHHAAYTSRPRETVITGRTPSNEGITIGSTSYTAK